MTSSSWSLDMVPPIWTKTAFSWKRAARESTLRSDIQRHFSLERLITSCSDFTFCIILSLSLCCVSIFYACHQHLLFEKAYPQKDRIFHRPLQLSKVSSNEILTPGVDSKSSVLHVR